jgi:hypothetical protein
MKKYIAEGTNPILGIMQLAKGIIKAILSVGLGLALIYSLMLPDPKGIGLFVLIVSFSVLTTVGSVIVSLVFKKGRIRFIHYVIVVANIVNVALPFFWMRSTIKVDTFVVVMLVNHLVGLVAAAEVLLKLIDKK